MQQKRTGKKKISTCIVLIQYIASYILYSFCIFNFKNGNYEKPKNLKNKSLNLKGAFQKARNLQGAWEKIQSPKSNTCHNWKTKKVRKPSKTPSLWFHEEDEKVIVENLIFKTCKTYLNEEDMKVSKIF